jgi:tripartite ATP-independent transporter DctP family solute receptor
MKRNGIHASLIVMFAIVIVGFICVMAPSASEAATAVRTIKLAHVLPPGSNFDIGAHKFKDLVEKASNGKIKVEIYAGDMTTDEVEAAEMVRSGNLDMAWTSTGSLSAFVKDLMLLDMPFLFRDTNHVNKVLMGPIGDKLLKEFDASHIKALAFAEDGWREITNNKRPINKLSDMKGLKLRTMMNDMNADMYKALGAVPTPIPSGEIYSSIQTGLVSGQDNGVYVANSVGYLAIQPYVCMIQHFYSSGVVLASEKLWNGLNPAERKIVKDAAVEAGKYQRDWFWKTETNLTKKLAKEKKITVTYPKDRAEWVKAVQPVYTQYFKKYPQWKPMVDQINKTK